MKRASLPLVAAIAIGTILVFVQRAPAPIASPVAVTVTLPAGAHPGYEIISDEELLATLKDRPLLVLPQENGPQKIVLLNP